MKSNTKAALCYVFGIISALIFLAIEKNDEFVRKSAAQSLAFNLLFLVVDYAVRFIPIFKTLIASSLRLFFVVVAVILIIKALQRIYYKLPFVGDFAEKYFLNLFLK